MKQGVRETNRVIKRFREQGWPKSAAKLEVSGTSDKAAAQFADWALRDARKD